MELNVSLQGYLDIGKTWGSNLDFFQKQNGQIFEKHHTNVNDTISKSQVSRYKYALWEKNTFGFGCCFFCVFSSRDVKKKISYMTLVGNLLVLSMTLEEIQSSLFETSSKFRYIPNTSVYSISQLC